MTGEAASAATASSQLGGEVAYCAGLVREGDRDRFLAALFAPAARRPALYALDAFDLETGRIGARVRDPLAGEIRIQWWRDVLEGGRSGEARANPVAAALLAALETDASAARTPLLELLDARALALYGEPFATQADFAAYARATQSALVGVKWRILASEGAEPPPGGIDEAGLALTIRDILLRLAAEAARGRSLLPQDLLQSEGVSAADVLAARASAGLKEALAAMRREARVHCARLQAALFEHRSDANAVFLPALLVPLYLDRIERARDRPFAAAAEVPLWRRQWRMWRLARRIA